MTHTCQRTGESRTTRAAAPAEGPRSATTTRTTAPDRRLDDEGTNLPSRPATLTERVLVCCTDAEVLR